MTLSELYGKFTSIEKIKKGGQKIVYKVETSQGDVFALKIINNATDMRVLQEIEILKQFTFPNTPRIFEHGIVFDEAIKENVLYIIEEFINGSSLRDWINSGNKFSLTVAFKILYDLLAIEIELEEKKILHRDINPNNIILDSNYNMHLIDFGLAKNLCGQALTMTAAAHGPFTPGYAPYEQFTNMKLQQDVRTDLFQIGVTIYEGCTGKNPFVEPNETMYEIMSRTINIMPPGLVLDGDKKGMFSQFINMLMAKNQSQRPDSASDAMRYLNAIKLSLDLEE